MIKDIPLITVACVLVALWLILNYTRHYGRFAKHDPDRLQSEEYRQEITRLQMSIAAKGLLPEPVPADDASTRRPSASNLPEPEASDGRQKDHLGIPPILMRSESYESLSLYI